MLKKLKDKRIWIVLIIAIIFIVGIISVICFVNKENETGKLDTKVEVNNTDESDEEVQEPYNGDGLTIAGDDETDEMQEDSVKAPASWSNSSKETKQTDNLDQTESNVKEESKKSNNNKQDEDSKQQDNDSIEEDESLESESVSYGRIF